MLYKLYRYRYALDINMYYRYNFPRARHPTQTPFPTRSIDDRKYVYFFNQNIT